MSHFRPGLGAVWVTWAAADKISLIFQYTALLWSCEACCNSRTLFEHEPRETFWANILKYEMKLLQRKHKENFSLVNEKIARENQFEDFHFEWSKIQIQWEYFEKYLK